MNMWVFISYLFCGKQTTQEGKGGYIAMGDIEAFEKLMGAGPRIWEKEQVVCPWLWSMR